MKNQKVEALGRLTTTALKDAKKERKHAPRYSTGISSPVSRASVTKNHVCMCVCASTCAHVCRLGGCQVSLSTFFRQGLSLNLALAHQLSCVTMLAYCRPFLLLSSSTRPTVHATIHSFWHFTD